MKRKLDWIDRTEIEADWWTMPKRTWLSWWFIIHNRVLYYFETTGRIKAKQLSWIYCKFKVGVIKVHPLIQYINRSIRSEISRFRLIWWPKLATDRSLKLIDSSSGFKVPEENERWNTCPSVGSTCFFFSIYSCSAFLFLLWFPFGE